MKTFFILLKHNIIGLKAICGEVIYNELNSRNAIEILLIADKFNAIELRNKVIDYIARNLSSIGTESQTDFKVFISKNCDLVPKIFEAIEKILNN
jgi:hypothetical protein